MFKAIADRRQKESQEEGDAQVGEEGDKPPQLMGELEGHFGTNLLVTGGIISESAAQRLSQYRPNPEAMQVLEMVEKGQIEEASAIVLKEEFMRVNNIFVNSGQLLKKALDYNHFDFAKQLIHAGYNVPNNFMIDAINDGDEVLIRKLLTHGLYNKDELEVEMWYMLHSGYYDFANQLAENEPSLSEFVNGRKFYGQSDAHLFLTDVAVLENAIRSALTESHDKLAALMLGYNPKMIKKELIYLATTNVCLDFLRLVWTGHYKFDEAQMSRRKKQSLLWEVLENDIKNQQERMDLSRRLKIKFIVNELLTKLQHHAVKKVLDWPGACDEPGVIKILMQHGEQALAAEYLEKSTVGVNSDDLIEAIDWSQYDLCIKMLYFKEARVALDKLETQEKLIKLMDQGESCLAAAEMLNMIPMMNWHFELTKDFCIQMNRFAKKSNDLLFCPSPILFCVLTAEIMKKIGNASFPHQNRCFDCSENFLEYGMQIEKAIKDEEELKYFLTQKDSRGRAVLSILSKNRFYTLLEPDEVGTIVNKMWMGSNRNYGIAGASTVYKSWHSTPGSEEAMGFAKRMDTTKPYMFHYEQWTESNYYRYNAVAFSTFLLVVFYQMVIYTAIDANAFEDVTQNQRSLIYLRISQVWIVSILIENILFFVFGRLTRRGFEFNGWRKLDLLMFLLMGTLTLDLHKKYMGDGNELEDLDPILFNAGLHSVLVTCIWVRLMSVLITSKRFGPLLRMIYLMSLEVVNFFLIYICLGLCSAAVFTAMFNKTNANMIDFSTSLRTLFAASLANFDLEGFTDNIALGGILLSIYLLISYVMLLNLLIALLSNIYSDLKDRVDSEHRAVVISYYDRLYWNDKYGFLIFLPPPFTFLTILFVPFFIFKKNTEELNTRLCQVFYIIYAVPQFVYFVCRSLICWIFLYIKGFVIYGKTGSLKQTKTIQIVHLNTQDLKGQDATDGYGDDNEQQQIKHNTFNTGKALAWTFIGLPWVFWSVMRDSYDFWRIIYLQMDKITEENERSKIYQTVNEKLMNDFQIVLKSADKETLSVSEFFEMWKLIDPNHEHPNHVNEFIVQFAKSYTDPTLDLVTLRRLLPNRPYYSEEYLQRARHVNVPWISKGLKKYKQKCGSIVEGTMASIPKDIGSKDRNVLKRAHIEELSRSVRDLEVMYRDLNESSTAIRNEVNTQNRMINMLRAKRQDW